MAYVGFNKLQGKIEGKGYSKEAAGAIAASVGRKKYGKKKFDTAAAKGKSLKGAKPKKGGSMKSKVASHKNKGAYGGK